MEVQGIERQGGTVTQQQHPAAQQQHLQACRGAAGAHRGMRGTRDAVQQQHAAASKAAEASKSEQQPATAARAGTFMGGRRAKGACPCASSSSVMPKDQMSARAS